MTEALGENDKELPPLVEWDVHRGWRPLNTAGRAALMAPLDDDESEMAVGDEEDWDVTEPDTMLKQCQVLPGVTEPEGPGGTIVFLHNFHRQLDQLKIIQGVWNLRDPYKMSRRTLIMLCPAVQLPPELTQDVFVLDEPLPNHAELAAIVTETVKGAGGKVNEEEIIHAADWMIGLAPYSAEQVTAMSLTAKGIKMTSVKERQRAVIEQQGLKVYRGGETLDQIGGYEILKTYLREVGASKYPPGAIVFFDEIDKVFMDATANDNTGVSQDQKNVFLGFMDSVEATGIALIGPPGTSKSTFAKAFGNELDRPTIVLDPGNLKGGIVGESEAKIRHAMKVIAAVSQGRPFFIGTCNAIGIIAPEIRRRFSSGTFFVDIPTHEERETIWKLYMKRYGLEGQEIPPDESWTGAEIRTCCQRADAFGKPLTYAARYVVPVAIGAAEKVKNLRREAHNTYLSASYEGYYQDPGRTQMTATERALESKKEPMQGLTGGRLVAGLDEEAE